MKQCVHVLQRKSTESWPTKWIQKTPQVSVVFNSTKHEKSAPVDTLQCRIFESGHFTKLPSENQGRKSTMLVNCTRKISNVLFADNVLFILKLAGGKTLKVPRNNNKGSDVSTKCRKKGLLANACQQQKKMKNIKEKNVKTAPFWFEVDAQFSRTFYLVCCRCASSQRRRIRNKVGVTSSSSPKPSMDRKFQILSDASFP